MRILITGGAGFIGSNLARYLKTRGHQVTTLDRREGEGTPHNKGDILEKEFLKKVIPGNECIIHLAAQVSVPESIAQPEETMRVNVDGSENILAAAKEAGVRKVILASSAAVYGEEPNTPTREEEPLKPMSPYAESKIEMEKLAARYAQEGLATCCLRFFNVYGPRQEPTSQYAAVIPAFISRALKDEALTIYGDGEQTRDFIYIADLCAAIEKALEKGRGSINLASGRTTSINALAKSVITLTGSASIIRHEEARAGDPRESLADVTKAKEELGFEATTSFEEGLKETIDWFRKA